MTQAKPHPLDHSSQKRETNTHERRNQTLFIATAGIGFMLLYFAWLLWGRDDLWERMLAGGMVVVFSSGLAAWAIYGTWRIQKEERTASQSSWKWLLAAALIWLAADLVRLFLLMRHPQGIQTSQVLDLLFLAGAASFWMVLLRYPQKARPAYSPLGRFMDALLISTGILTLVWMIAIQPVMSNILSGLQVWTVVFYPLADLISILLLLNLFLFSDLTTMPRAFGWLSLALVAFVTGDLAYIATSLTRGYLTGGSPALAWVSADIFIILAAWKARQPEVLGAALFRRLFQRIQAFLPLLTVLLLAWYTVLAWQLTGRFTQTGLWVAALLGLILIARQGLQAGEVEMQRYASLVNSVAEPAFVCDRTGILRLANPALVRAAGYAPDSSLAGTPLADIFPLVESAQTILTQSLEGGWSGEVWMNRRGGNPFPVYLSLRPLQPDASERLTLAGTAHDLSEIKRQQADLEKAYAQIAADRTLLEQLNQELEGKVAEKTASLSQAYRQLEEQNRTLQELDRLKSDFVSLVSHELRAPLTNINGGIELLLSASQALPERASQNLQLVQVEIQRLTRFVETILDLSALDAGRMPLYPAPIDLESVAVGLKAQMLHRAGAERIYWQAPAHMPPLLADAQALNSVLFHLLDNALKYAPQGEILVTASIRDGQACLEVRDHGPGISEEAMAHLFDRFYRQSSDAQEVYGHGLGLYIVRRLLEAMQGSIHAANCSDGGARFTCLLPVDEQRERN